LTASRPSKADRLLDEAERAQRAGDFAAAAVALRGHLDEHPDDQRSRLRFASVLTSLGERARARALLASLEAASDNDGVRREAVRRLADLDEADGAVLAAAERWEKILADDIDDPQARTHLALLRPTRSDVEIDASQTLVSPAGVETLRFRLLRELGRGATATVYLARDEALQLDVALKVLHPQLAGSGRSESLRRFFADARVAAAVRHPGVVAIYDVDEAARAVAMEWIAGGTLRERLREHPGGLPTSELRATARSLLGALGHVHAAGIVHGDLKPSNLLLRAPGAVVLADFGSAGLAGDPRAAGTPLYFAPEQFQGTPASPATDLYAVGAILWEAATGRPLRSHADLMRGGGPAPTISTNERAAIEAAHGAGLLRLLVLFLGDVAARGRGFGLAVEIDL
jgi:tRNA A-37 threonylcarbamoyl transferase component Bud32